MKKLYFLLGCIFLLVTAKLTTAGKLTDPRDEDEGWTIVSIYQVNNFASGLAWDGEYFYIGSYGGALGANIHRFDPVTGTQELFFSGSQSAAYGLTYDGEYLWTIDREPPTSTPAYALKLDMEGNVVAQHDLPDFYMSGIAWDDGDFWVATYFPNPGTIYHMDTSEEEWEVISSFTPPQNQPWDLARQDDFIWIAEYNESNLHQVELDGTLVATFPGSNYRTSGVAWDGSFLWYVSRENNGDSFLYKVDMAGGGTPQINVSTAYDFGNVTLGQSQSWNMLVSNTGSGDLEVQSMDFPEGSPFSMVSELPVTIGPGESQTLEVQFAPEAVGIFEQTALLSSNDPAALTLEIVLSGNGLASGPYLHTTQQEIQWGNVRLNSSSKHYLYLQNMGDALLEISGVHIDQTHFYIDHLVEFPIVLSPVESLELPVWFMPTIPGSIEAEASIMYNDPESSPRIIGFSGSAHDQQYPMGEVIWQHHFTGSYDFQAKAIMSIPDINGDEKPDLIIGTRDNYIRAFNGNASGNADILWELQMGTVEYPKAITLGSDINGDGLPDIIAGTAWGDRAVTAISTQTGEILWRFETNIYGNGGWVYMVDAKYDYNDNGYLDVLAATGDDADGNGPKRIFCLDGQTGDIIWQTPLNAAGYAVVAVEDFTGDGIPDVVAGATSPSNQGRVVGINGANGNIEWDITTAGTAVWALEQISDITGNQISDIIAGTFNGMYYLIDVTNGDIEYSGSLGNSIVLDFWKAGDLNEDGYEDIIPAYSSIPNAVAISGQDGQLLWNTLVADQPWSVAVLRDINGDGINDVAVGTLFNNNMLYFISGSDGEIMEQVSFSSAVDAVGYIPDVTGDGSAEVVAGGRNGFLGVFSGGNLMTTQEFEVTFEVKSQEDLSLMLEGAVISISQRDTQTVTDENGIATAMLESASYNFTVTLENYHTYGGSFEVDFEDLFVEVLMEPAHTPTYSITFEAVCQETPSLPLNDVAIEIMQRGITLYTDENGMAMIDLENGLYEYNASREHYFPQTGTFEVADEDKHILLEMEPDGTGISVLPPQDVYVYPNPFSDFTRFVFHLSKDTEVSLFVFDSSGRLVKSFENRFFPAGENQYFWNGHNQEGAPVDQGLYFYEIRADQAVYRNRLLRITK